MMKPGKANLTAADVRARLAEAIDHVGSLRELAKQWGIDVSVLSRTVNGKIEPPPQVLERLGLIRTETTYRLRGCDG